MAATRAHENCGILRESGWPCRPAFPERHFQLALRRGCTLLVWVDCVCLMLRDLSARRGVKQPRPVADTAVMSTVPGSAIESQEAGATSGSASGAGKMSDKSVFYRNRLANFIAWVIMAIAALYFVIAIGRDLREGQPSVIIGLDAILLTAFLIPAVRVPRHGVVVTPTELVIRNVFKTHRLHWDQVERFELNLRSSPPRVGVVVLADGSRIRMTGVSYGLASSFAQTR